MLVALVLVLGTGACSRDEESAQAPEPPAVEQTAAPATLVVAPAVEPETAPEETMTASSGSAGEAVPDAAESAEPGGTTAHEVRAQITSWEPLVLFAKPGDTVTWTNMIGHDTESIDGMIPAGATKWRSKLGERYTITLEKEGAYVYKCNPHISTGMVGAIVVGDQPPANVAAIEAALDSVPVAANMVGRAIRKMKKAIEAQWAAM